MKADTATWPIRFAATADDLATASAKSDADRKQVVAFLTAGGLDVHEIGC